MMKRHLKILIIVLLIAFIPFFASYPVSAEEEDQTTSKSLDVEELIQNLDLSALDLYLAELQSYNGEIVGSSASDYVKALLSGEEKFDINVILKIISSSFIKAKDCLSIVSLLISISIIWSIVSGIEFKNNSNSAKKAVNIACLSIMSVIVLIWIYTLLTVAADFFDDFKKLCDAVFPAFFTLLSAGGAPGSATALSPSAAVLSVILIALIKNVVFPLAIATLIIYVAGNISEEMSLGALGGFIDSLSGWIMKTGFYVFAAFLGTQGIFSGINDSISLRLGKFALSKYVPLIGGYLSDGFNYVIAGSIIIKNALGVTAILLIFIRALPVIISLILASLSLKLVCAIAEPLGIKCVNSVLSKIDGCLKTIRAAIVGTSFLFVIFVAAVMTCGSSVI